MNRSGTYQGRKIMTEIEKAVDHIRHERFRPLYQSLKAHIEIAHNANLHISPSVLKDLVKRLQIIETDVMGLIIKEV
jgi:ADP-dependent phosphofructokinase/glucokinase